MARNAATIRHARSVELGIEAQVALTDAPSVLLTSRSGLVASVTVMVSSKE